MERVVCINDNWEHKHTLRSWPCEKDICDVDGIVTKGSDTGYYIKGFNEETSDGRIAWDVTQFRPVTDCGNAICEYIEEVHFKKFEYLKAISV